MNDLGYKLLVDKTLKRRVNILSKLSESPYPLSLEVIRKLSNSSIITLQSDIKYLIETFPNDFCLEEFNNSQSLCKLNTCRTISYHMNFLIRDSPLFFIIENLFNGKKENLSYYSDNLFIAESTLRKYLNTLKEVLKDYHLTLSLNPLELIGKEINVRYFYFHYFRYSHTNELAEVTDAHLNSTYKILRELAFNYDLGLNIDYYRIVSWTLIIEKRISQGHYISFPQEVFSKFRYMTSFIKFNSSIKEHFKKLNYWPNLASAEILFAYLLRLDSIIYEDNKKYFTDDFFDYLKEYDDLTTSFFSNINLNIALNIPLKTMLQAYLTNLSALTSISPMFQKNHAQLKLIVEQDHPKILKIWTDLLLESGQFEYSYDVSVSLTLLSVSHLNTHHSVLFALTGEPSSLTYYKNRALKCVPKNMTVIFLFNKPLSNELLEQMSIGICVSNLSPTKKLVISHHFRLSDIPRSSEWSELQDFLHSYTTQI